MPSGLTKVRQALRAYSNPEKAKLLARFFKTGKGEYAQGDMFIGVTVPNTRSVARAFKDIEENDIAGLLQSSIHEERILALLVLVHLYKTSDDVKKDSVARLYIKHLKHVNNWDLVDLSAHKILGPHCQKHDSEILFKLARSSNLWERRIAMLSTAHFIAQGDAKLALQIATILKDDNHDLIHKAVGWMLREIGKRCGQDIEEKFLDQWANTMPRTMLRYAIERFPQDRKKHYMTAR